MTEEVSNEVAEPATSNSGFNFDDMEAMHDHEVSVAKESKAEEEVEASSLEEEVAAAEPKVDVFTVKVDGEDVEVTLDELRENYSGKIPFDKKFSELDVSRKAFERDQGDLAAGLEQVLELMGGEDPIQAMEFLAEMTGASPLDIRNKFNALMDKRHEETAHLSEEQRQLLSAQKELEYYKSLQEQKQIKAQNKEAGNVFKQAVTASYEKLGVSPEEWVEQYNAVESDPDYDFNTMSDDQIINLVEGTHEAEQLDGAVYELMKEVNPDVEPDEEAISLLKDAYRNNEGATIELLKEVAIEQFGTKASKNISRKIKKSQPRNIIKEEGPINHGSDAWTFDDLE